MSDTTARPPLADLLEDQRRRWHDGAAPPVEEYLALHPGLTDDAGAVLDLIFQEVVLRERRGESPQVEEYARRFPHLAETLRLQFSVDRALWRETPPTGGSVGDVLPTNSDPAAAPALPAEFPHLDGYEIRDLLGRGGMGVVYRAWQAALKRVVALKFLRGPAGAAAHELARFRTEAEAIARLQHPNVVQIYEVGEQRGVGERRGRPYLVLEFVAGGSLADRLDGTPWPALPAARLAETLARAVHHARECGIVHRDLKPANVLLADGEGPSPQSPAPHPPSVGIPKIADFGLAKFVAGGGGTLTGSGEIMGTPSYMAPEQAAGQARQVGPAADVYALGAILYELLTGRPPFRGETPLDTLRQVTEDEPVPPRCLQPRVPRDLETVCLKCLQKDPARRYGSAAALADDLRRFGAGEPVLARPVGAAERAWRWCRRRPAVAGLLGLLAAVVVGALVGLTALWQRAEGLRQDAETKRAEAEAANAEALEYFGVARDVINGYTERVKEDPQLREADLRPLRKDLLATVVPFYERLTRREGTRSTLQAEQAQAHDRLADVMSEIDDPAKGIEQLQAAIRILERLVAERPGEPDYQHRLAKQYHNVSTLRFEDRRLDQAESELMKSIALKEDLAARYPEVAEYQDALAISLCSLGNIYRATRRPDLAEATLQRARTIQQGLVDQHPDRADYKEVLAITLQSLGDYHLNNKQMAAAEKELAEAIRLGEDVTRQRPRDDLKSQDHLAHIRISLGNLFSKTGRPDRAAAEFDRAIQALGPVTRNYPSYIPCQEVLAICLAKLGALHEEAGQAPQGEAELQRAVEVHQLLARLQPNRVRAQNQLAEALTNLAAFYSRREQPARAGAETQKALAVLEGVTRDHPDETTSLRMLAEVCWSRAFLMRSGGQAESALPWYARAQRLADDVLKKQPDNGRALALLVKLHLDRAAAYMALARYDAALQDWDRALALDDGQHRERFRASRAVVLAYLKRHAQAVTEAEDLAGAKAPEPLHVFHAACACAVSSAAVREDAALAAAERDKLAGQYADRALALLQRLHDAGYFRAPKRVKDLQTEKDLDAVRAREDFKALLAAVQGQAKPPAP
jgi:tetratricopeptide (TPR) repeat protein